MLPEDRRELCACIGGYRENHANRPNRRLLSGPISFSL